MKLKTIYKKYIWKYGNMIKKLVG